MKKLLAVTLIFLLILCMSAFVFAGEQSLKFTWEQPMVNEDSTPLTDLAGWELYYAETLGGPYQLLETINYVEQQDTYTTTKLFSSPDNQEKTWFFVILAFDTSGNKSAFSNEVAKKIDFQSPPIPINFVIEILKQ